MAAAKGLIFLDTKNAILHEQVKQRLVDGRRDRDGVTISFSEFDDVRFRITCDPATASVIRLDVAMIDLKNLLANGSQAVIDRAFPSMSVQPEEGFDLAISFDCEKVEDKAALLANVADIKKLCLSGPLERAFNAMKEDAKASPVITMNYRKTDIIYVCPRDGKVTVILKTDFEDSTEKAIARVFLQEFVEAQRTIRNAPSCAYSVKPPGELNGVAGVPLPGSGAPEPTGYISFAVEKRHVQGAHMDTVIGLLTGFRSYLSYHIKCSKTYLHMRMRHRMDEWMKVLKRAIPEEEKEKKTMGGKTFRKAVSSVMAANVFQGVGK